ncbi:unnamed protein product [Rangifer tarandus platyrhynchus]|uniref:Uncharacterized protein n=1 Tax=Rangifer tarandus platyrhynchus TaxID=3082113 RepID=A0AC59ZS75_RANTA
MNPVPLDWNEGRAKGHVLRLPHPADKSPSRQATLSVWGPRGSPESKQLKHWGTPRQSPRWTRSSGSEMMLSPKPHLQGLSLRLLSAPLRKRAVEAELETCRAELRAVEAQLLEVLEEKLRLRQEVEAWEEDMQWLVRQQVESQLQRESQSAPGAPTGPETARTPWIRFPLSQWGRWR